MSVQGRMESKAGGVSSPARTKSFILGMMVRRDSPTSATQASPRSRSRNASLQELFVCADDRGGLAAHDVDAITVRLFKRPADQFAKSWTGGDDEQ